MGNQRNEKNVAQLEERLVLSGIWDVFSISVVVNALVCDMTV